MEDAPDPQLESLLSQLATAERSLDVQWDWGRRYINRIKTLLDQAAELATEEFEVQKNHLVEEIGQGGYTPSV